MPDISGGLGTVSAGTITPDRAVPLSGWFSRGIFVDISGNYGTALVNTLAYKTGNTYWAASPALADVQAAIALASPGDTVRVPAGAGTWSDLNIRKPILLIGAGIGNTIITRGGTYALTYYPSDYNSDYSFRLSGFSLDGAGGITMDLGQDAKSASPVFTIQTRVRIDHNRFYSTGGSGGNHMHYRGTYGCVDNNTFEDYTYPLRNINTSMGASWWNAYATPGFRYIVGDKNNIYFEDNVFSDVSTAVSNSQYSGRYAFRHNAITITSEMYPCFDLHGNQDTDSMCSSFGGEIHDNTINCGGNRIDLIDHRGGQMLVYNNLILNSSSPYIEIRDAYGDEYYPTTSPDPQYPNRTYYFNNRHGVGGTILPVTISDTSNGKPAVNVEFFTDDTTNGAAGCDSGLLSARPVSGTITNQGYWATDESILYRWSGSAWTSYYTPYTYPHPLRSDSIVGD